MLYILEIIHSRLMEKGMTPIELNRLIRDTSNIIHDNKSLSNPLIRNRLTRLGWNQENLDNYTLRLVCTYLEDLDYPLEISSSYTKIDTANMVKPGKVPTGDSNRLFKNKVV